MDVIKRLNDLRLERNMSVYRLAELSGINQSTLANTFSRGTVPSIKNLELLCHALGITLSQFFSDGEENMSVSPFEATMLKNYRKLSPSLKTSVADVINAIPYSEK